MDEEAIVAALRRPDWENELELLGNQCFGNEPFSTFLAKSGRVLEQFVHMLEKRDPTNLTLLFNCLNNIACNSSIGERDRVLGVCSGRLLSEVLATYEWATDYSVKSDIVTFLSFMSHSATGASILDRNDVTKVFEDVLSAHSGDHVDSVYAFSLMGLANIKGQEEMSQFTADNEKLRPIITMLEASMTGESYAAFFWIPQYVLPALKNLTVGDANKRSLYELRLVPLIFRVLLEESAYYRRYPDLVDKQLTRELALRVLLNMSFLEPARLQMPLESTHVLSARYAEDDNSLQLLKRLDWALHPEESKPVDVENVELAASAIDKLTHSSAAASRYAGKFVMISYSWAQQPLVLAMAAKLKEFGVPYWLDKEQMAGSTLEAMAAAVEGCSAMICCISKNYKQSEPCQREADYAYKLKRPIIPVKVGAFCS